MLIFFSVSSDFALQYTRSTILASLQRPISVYKSNKINFKHIALNSMSRNPLTQQQLKGMPPWGWSHFLIAAGCEGLHTLKIPASHVTFARSLYTSSEKASRPSLAGALDAPNPPTRHQAAIEFEHNVTDRRTCLFINIKSTLLGVRERLGVN
jgi:hypothetical protein